MDDLEAFRKKVAAEESKQKDDTPQRGAQLSMQLKLLANFIARGDYDRARQMIENFGGYSLPPQFQEEWLQLADLLNKDIASLKDESLKKWSRDVNQLVSDTRKACLEAKTSDDLDALLLACSALQMRAQNSNTVMNERVSSKLSGVGETLTNWANYLDFKNAGDDRKANASLRNLRQSSSGFPVLTVTDIESHFSAEPGDPTDTRAALAKVFEGVNSPDDLPAAIARLKAMAANPLNPQASSLMNYNQTMETLLAAWKAAQAGDSATALTAVERSPSSFGDSAKYFEPLRAQIETRVLKTRSAAWTKTPQNPDESTSAYLGRILDELNAAGNYAMMSDVMALAGQLSRTPSNAFVTDRQAIEQYLAGQRFEASGDALAAVTSYRLVVGLPSGRYAPTVPAQEALKRLQASAPEAFKSYDGVLSEQIRGLGQQMQMQLSRPMPGRGYQGY